MLRVIAILVTILVLVLSYSAHAEEVSRAQVKGLDEQVQEIKSDVLAIAAELNELEEKLLYPSHTQVAVFVSLAEGEEFAVDSVGISLDGKEVIHHLYTFKELEALRRGGVQRIYTGNIQTGAHQLEATLIGRSAGGADFQTTENFTIHKEVGPGIVEMILAQRAITFKDR